MSLDRALDGVPFAIDKFRCLEAARMLAKFKPDEEHFPWSLATPIAQVAFKTLFVSICHRMNWDVLQSALAEWMLPDTDRRLAEFAATSPKQIRELLATYARQERVLPHQRASMLRDTATTLLELSQSDGPIRRLLKQPHLEGADGFYAQFGRIAAFQGDPLEKKLRVLAHDLHREGIMRFSDPQNLRPAVEYHLLRLYLRTGRVFPTRPAVVEALTGEPRPARRRLVMLLRETVDQAMRDCAQYAGLDVATLNYLEWQLARTICISELGPEWHPHCVNAPAQELPHDVARLVAGPCPYGQSCRTLGDRGYEWFNEPQFEKAIY
ncbi:hypothetical protein [Sphingomonas jatrophae]|uniref:Uncharacterized protein n=1 Tax=Sphingomonas jatrophae TaxID=1166337 RepID=A0A1I6JLN3_9SPHN|nr:hypothetical protein [Sphingomonas jatrophae]SFR79854.1 hypothetical protein SAMN05192580_0477 [Sphingomonas jatrophae]